MVLSDGPLSQRSKVTRHQAELMVKLIIKLEREVARRGVAIGASGSQRDWQYSEDRRWIFHLEEYRLFELGAYACGFVCRDIRASDLVNAAASNPAIIDNWDIRSIRKYLHTLWRSERWQGGDYSVVFEAVSSGALGRVANRLSSRELLGG